MSFVEDAFDKNWIAPAGENVDLFEEEICGVTGAKSATALSSGTAAVFLGLKALGVGEGDTVFCSDLTFAGSCFPIAYLNAKPVFIDSEPGGCNMSPQALEKALYWSQTHGKLPKAVVIVDLYGIPADFDRLLPVCQAYGVPVLEDSAEALGATFRGAFCGTLGEIGVFSFNGNKIITTSGGGMAVCRDSEHANKIKFWASQSREPVLHYEHKEIGYNFRMSNICAGIGRGQLTGIWNKIGKRRMIREIYRSGLEGCPISMPSCPSPGKPNYWLTVIVLQDTSGREFLADQIIHKLAAENIESRPVWKPMHEQPVFQNAAFIPHDSCAEGSKMFRNGICLPSGDALEPNMIQKICGLIRSCFG